MSVNVFRKYPDNKITFSDRSVLCGELEVIGSKVIFCVNRTRKFRMSDMLFRPIVDYI